MNHPLWLAAFSMVILVCSCTNRIDHSEMPGTWVIEEIRTRSDDKVLPLPFYNVATMLANGTCQLPQWDSAKSEEARWAIRNDDSLSTLVISGSAEDLYNDVYSLELQTKDIWTYLEMKSSKLYMRWVRMGAKREP